MRLAAAQTHLHLPDAGDLGEPALDLAVGEARKPSAQAAAFDAVAKQLPADLDAQAVIRASQAISQEIVLSSLRVKLAHVPVPLETLEPRPVPADA